MKQLPKIALIGRANVGKSTLFNTLTEQRKAIVSKVAGTTRDRNYTTIRWQGCNFQLIDTGGIDIVHTVDIEKDILKQTNFAIKEADIVLFLVDVKEGLMPQDKEVAKTLRKSKKSIILIVNKADNQRLAKEANEFYQLGLGDLVTVSALNGTGTGDLLDNIVQKLSAKSYSSPEPIEQTIKIAFIGKPNVGKSTLVNAILGSQRVITSAEPYTTRDAQDIELTYKNQHYTLIDTAGIRKKAKIKNVLEKFSVKQALASIHKADIALLITDVSEPLGKQDKTLSHEILKSQTSLIIIANKWDKIKDKTEKTITEFLKYYQSFFPYLHFAPVMFISALEKQRVKKVLELASEIYQERLRQIDEKILVDFFKKTLAKHPPARGKGVLHPKLYHLKQIGINPPQFELLKDRKSDLHNSYVRFIEKQLRQEFGFLGTPIIIKYRKLT
ncbi:ribosome biogenesis GTPase Der [Patescibacteria group bacterium]|nr:ribosome biogenesis GTPase Der [Patescibacteria group bacterium]